MALAGIVVEPPEEGVVVDPMTWFPSPGPFELEIGCGKGGFLLSRARANPEARLLGIEWASKFYRYAADRLARWGIANARIMRTDAGLFVTNHLPPACVSVLHLYHPDPWPKKRHHKRRLIRPAFVEAAARALRPGGRWLVQSDHAEYFAHIQAHLQACPALRPIERDEQDIALAEDWAGTNFEIKYRREGRPIHRAGYVRAP
jgi:tRNA (guanine-N7-)-methyltransferase